MSPLLTSSGIPAQRAREGNQRMTHPNHKIPFTCTFLEPPGMETRIGDRTQTIKTYHKITRHRAFVCSSVLIHSWMCRDRCVFVFNAIKKIDMLYTILFIQNKSEHMQLDQIIFDTELVQPVVSGPRRDGGGGVGRRGPWPGAASPPPQSSRVQCRYIASHLFKVRKPLTFLDVSVLGPFCLPFLQTSPGAQKFPVPLARVRHGGKRLVEQNVVGFAESILGPVQQIRVNGPSVIQQRAAFSRH